jgi:hypothetical protein
VTEDDELREYVQRATAPFFHPTGTCAIGTDERAVVDPELRVHGIDGLPGCRRLGHALAGSRQHERHGAGDRRTCRRDPGLVTIRATVPARSRRRSRPRPINRDLSKLTPGNEHAPFGALRNPSR